LKCLLAAALHLSAEVENAVIVSIVCDRGDRYLSTGGAGLTRLWRAMYNRGNDNPEPA